MVSVHQEHVHVWQAAIGLSPLSSDFYQPLLWPLPAFVYKRSIIKLYLLDGDCDDACSLETSIQSVEI